MASGEKPPLTETELEAMRTEKYRAILDALALRGAQAQALTQQQQNSHLNQHDPEFDGELRYTVVKFEDLLRDSEGTLGGIFRRFRVALDGLGRPPWRSDHYWKERLPKEPEWYDLDG